MKYRVCRTEMHLNSLHDYYPGICTETMTNWEVEEEFDNPNVAVQTVRDLVYSIWTIAGYRRYDGTISEFFAIEYDEENDEYLDVICVSHMPERESEIHSDNEELNPEVKSGFRQLAEELCSIGFDTAEFELTVNNLYCTSEWMVDSVEQNFLYKAMFEIEERIVYGENAH